MKEETGVLLSCGYAANSVNEKGKPSCAVHIGLIPNIKPVNPPNLTGRKARCAYGGNEVESNLSLAFFEYHPDKDYDIYYCGCHGWD